MEQKKAMTWGPARVIANWKMHGTTQVAQRLAHDIKAQIAKSKHQSLIDQSLNIHLCPPFPYLPIVGHMAVGDRIGLGAQDMYFEEQGAFTGAVGPYMLKDLGCDLVILGHSDRRQHFSETDEIIGKKVAKAAQRHLLPVLCVGESLDVYEAKKTVPVLRQQISAALAHVPQGTKLVIAYEPLWAIGSGRTPLGLEVAMFLKELAKDSLIQQYDITYLYGGSVSATNVGEFLTQPLVDGVLVGGVSLSAPKFVSLLEVASQVVVAPKRTWRY